MGPTLYLERDGSGQVLLGVRLIGEHDEERWTPDDTSLPGTNGSAGTAEDPSTRPSRAASWIRSRLAEGRTGKIQTLCLDLRGAACNWLEVPGDSASVLSAAARNAPRGGWGDWPEPPNPEAAQALHAEGATLDWRAASLQPLRETAGTAQSVSPGRLSLPRRSSDQTAAERTASRRVAVLAVSDLPVRLLLDELDALGVVVERVTTLAHAMAAAWYPGAAPRSADEDDPLVARDTSDAAVVMVEPSGRLQWCWSVGGQLLAAGSNRIDPEVFEPGAQLSAATTGRLSADWLAWSAQLGRSPSRIVCLVPESVGTPETAGALGRSVGAAWPNATVDLFRVPDPIGATAARLHERSAGGRPQRAMPADAAIASLQARPGRAHRSLYRWGAAACFAAAAAMVVLGVRLRGSAEEARTAARELIESQRGRVAEVLPPTADLTFPTLAAQSERDALRLAVPDASAVTPIRPVLPAAEEIGFAIASNPDAELDRLTILQSLITVQVSGPDTRSVEFVPSTLENGTDLFQWSPGDILRRNNTYQTVVNGVWRSGSASSASEGGPSS